MLSTTENNRYWLASNESFTKTLYNFRLVFVVGAVVIIWTAVAWSIGDDQPPPSAIAILLAFVISMTLFRFWMRRQYCEFTSEGLTVAIPVRRVVPYSKILDVRRVHYQKPLHEYGWATFIRRKVIPVWEKAPNVEIDFEAGTVKLNLYPRWFKLVQLTIESPDEFVERLNGLIKAHHPNP